MIGRLNKIVDYKGISKRKFYQITGLSNGYLDKEREVGHKKIEIIHSVFPEISLEWLLTSKGSMLKNEVENKGIYNRMPSVITIPESDSEKENIEVVPVKLAAGYVGGGLANMDFIESLPKFRLPFLNNGTYRCFGVGGHSMRSSVKDNDFFIGKFVNNLLNFSEGKIHAVVAPDADSLLMKRVFRHPKKKGWFILRSDNNDVVNTYPDIEINAMYIKEMWSYAALISFKEPSYDMDKFRKILKLNLDVVSIDTD